MITMSVAVLYLSIAPTRLTTANYGGDGGDFLAAILTKGIPHPTGYPTYMLLGILFQKVPVSTEVFRGVLVSLVPVAIGAGLLAGWVIYAIENKYILTYIAAATAGIAWGVAPLLFSQAVIVEVHGLQTLFVVLLLWWVILNIRKEERIKGKWVLGLSFLIGLGGGNHLTISLMIPVILFTLVYTLKQSHSIQLPLIELGLMIAGMLVYLYLPIRAKTYPAINWGNPQTWRGFLWEVTAAPYRSLLFSAHQPVIWERIRSTFSLLMDQFGALGLIAGIIGAIQFTFQKKWLRWILMWIFVAYFIFSIGYNTQDSVGYSLPAILVYAIWIGLAVPILWNIKWKRLSIGMLFSALLMASILIRIPGTRTRVDPRSQDQPARYAEQFLKDAPQDAFVYTITDQDTFPLWYYHFGLNERPDLRIIVLPLTQFVWYQQNLVHTYPDLNFPAMYTKDQPNADWGNELVELNPNRVVCYTQPTANEENGVTFTCNHD